MARTDLIARELEIEYRAFLDDEATDGIYKAKVQEMINRQETRLIVKINDLRSNPHFVNRARCLIENSAEELTAFQNALQEFVTILDPTYGKSVYEFHIGLCGNFGRGHVTPRTLTAKFLGQTICVQGIVSRASSVQPKLIQSYLYCPATNKVIKQKHYDSSSLDFHKSSSFIEIKDENGNEFELEEGKAIFKDSQKLTLQELPEFAPLGQIPRYVDVIVEYDLVNACNPGDRVQIVGTYRSLPTKKHAYYGCIFPTILIANYIALKTKKVQTMISNSDIRLCRIASKKTNIFEVLAASLAPSIKDNKMVKQALLCLLLGGVEKILHDGTRLRGDINILLIGDPAVAKSQLLRFILGCAPKAISTSGRCSSGVGLTAAVTTNPATKERQLEAGAMVLADRGIVCIDEFDKMSDIDRVAIHEVMEQGRVSICKAGIRAKLNARCSVLAAANPIYGKYDRFKTPIQNIAMQDSLLSRFDLLFIMLDIPDRLNDETIANFINRTSMYRPANEQDGEPTTINTSSNNLSTLEDREGEEMYERSNPLLHGADKQKIFTITFLRKYIHIAKRIKPRLTVEACRKLTSKYLSIRNRDEEESEGRELAGSRIHASLLEDSDSEASYTTEQTQPVTVRCMESLIRIATAHAKARLSKEVEVEDAEAANALVEFSIYQQKLIDRGANKKRKCDHGGTLQHSDTEDTMEVEQFQEERQQPKELTFTEEDKADMQSRLEEFKALIAKLSSENRGASLLDLDIVFNRTETVMKLSKGQFDALLFIMCDEKYIIIDGNYLYFL